MSLQRIRFRRYVKKNMLSKVVQNLIVVQLVQDSTCTCIFSSLATTRSSVLHQLFHSSRQHFIHDFLGHPNIQLIFNLLYYSAKPGENIG